MNQDENDAMEAYERVRRSSNLFFSATRLATFSGIAALQPPPGIVSKRVHSIQTRLPAVVEIMFVRFLLVGVTAVDLTVATATKP